MEKVLMKGSKRPNRIVVIIAMVLAPMVVHAAEKDYTTTIKMDGIKKMTDDVIGFLTSPWVSAVLGIIFILSLVGWLMDKQDDQFKQAAFRVMIGAGLLASTTTIIALITSASAALM